jgi:magnesium transporter
MAKSKHRKRNNYSLKKGLPPGTLHYIGDEKNFDVSIEQITYNELHYDSSTITDLELLQSDDIDAPVRWINIAGIHNKQLISSFGKIFGLHPLVQEDIMHAAQRPKLEDYDQYLYLVLRMISLNDETSEIRSEQVSIILFQNTVITFQENPEDIFDSLRERIKKGAGRIRKSRADYLAYCLIDSVVDHYFEVLERIGEKLEDVEEAIISNQFNSHFNELHNFKRELIFLRKSIWPLREVINYLYKAESKWINADTNVYFRDVYDHCIHVLDTLESYRDLTSGLMDLYLSSLSNKMNQIMKTLTIIATIFIPLTFVVGVYGMNFKNMPELLWHQGYFIIWIIMLLIATGMLWYFKKKKWF